MNFNKAHLKSVVKLHKGPSGWVPHKTKSLKSVLPENLIFEEKKRMFIIRQKNNIFF